VSVNHELKDSERNGAVKEGKKVRKIAFPGAGFSILPYVRDLTEIKLMMSIVV